MSLHGAIMNIVIDPADRSVEYRLGHRDARHAAAEIASEREAKILGLLERLDDVGERIEHWGAAYPTDVFPEPDLKRYAEVLEAAGLTIDRISASNMRYVATRMAEMIAPVLKDARAILEREQP